MEIGHIIPHIEALVSASDRPLTSLDITELINNAFGFMEDKITLEQVQTALEGIVEKYRSEFYPFEMRESGGGWQFLTKKEFHKTVAQLNGEKFLKRLSTAALETLAIIAYKQPITKADIEAIRGVSSDYSIQKLLEKELIVITGRNEDMPGKPLVYATSKNFVDYFGLNSVDDLPKLKEIFDEAMVQPSLIPPGNTETAEESIEEGDEEGTVALIVSENGELIESEEVHEDTAPEIYQASPKPDSQADVPVDDDKIEDDAGELSLDFADEKSVRSLDEPAGEEDSNPQQQSNDDEESSPDDDASEQRQTK